MLGRINNQFVIAFVLMILFYLVLTHATGASRIIASIGGNLGSLAKTFQGR